MMSHHDSLEQERLLKMFQEQKEGKTAGEFPDGKLSEHDEGALAFKVGSDPEKNVVILDFGKSIVSTAMRPEEAVQFAQMLIRHARHIAKEPADGSVALSAAAGVRCGIVTAPPADE